MTTKLILTHEVSGLGAAGDVVDVKDGYARNFLMPRGLATPWTKGGQRQLDQIRSARGKRAIANVEDAKALKAALESKPVVIAERAGQNGRL
ncbi:MAG: 50S ribosomal protein L9, partial [Brachybacterium tyrofermentans]